MCVNHKVIREPQRYKCEPHGYVWATKLQYLRVRREFLKFKFAPNNIKYIFHVYLMVACQAIYHNKEHIKNNILFYGIKFYLGKDGLSLG